MVPSRQRMGSQMRQQTSMQTTATAMSSTENVSSPKGTYSQNRRMTASNLPEISEYYRGSTFGGTRQGPWLNQSKQMRLPVQASEGEILNVDINITSEAHYRTIKGLESTYLKKQALLPKSKA